MPKRWPLLPIFLIVLVDIFGLTLIVPLLDQLPLIESAVGAGMARADSTPAPLESREVAGGFRITAYTPQGVSMLESLERVLGPLEGRS